MKRALSGRTSLGLLVCVVAAVLASPSVFAQAPYGPPGAGLPQDSAFAFAPDCNDPLNAVSQLRLRDGDLRQLEPGGQPEPVLPNAVVGGAGITPGFGLFTSAPAGGRSGHAQRLGRGGIPVPIELSQDVTVPANGILSFDYRAGWDLLTYGAALDRKIRGPDPADGRRCHDADRRHPGRAGR